jgi:hypothetical protein
MTFGCDCGEIIYFRRPFKRERKTYFEIGLYVSKKKGVGIRQISVERRIGTGFSYN